MGYPSQHTSWEGWVYLPWDETGQACHFHTSSCLCPVSTGSSEEGVWFALQDSTGHGFSEPPQYCHTMRASHALPAVQVPDRITYTRSTGEPGCMPEIERVRDYIEILSLMGNWRRIQEYMRRNREIDPFLKLPFVPLPLYKRGFFLALNKYVGHYSCVRYHKYTAGLLRDYRFNLNPSCIHRIHINSMVQSKRKTNTKRKPKQLGPIGKARQQARDDLKTIKKKQRELKSREATIRRELGLKKKKTTKKQ